MAKKWITEYKNGVYFKVTLYNKARPGCHDSDRIRLKIVPETGQPIDFYMHALEAVDIIAALSAAVGQAMNDDLPLWSTD